MYIHTTYISYVRTYRRELEYVYFRIAFARNRACLDAKSMGENWEIFAANARARVTCIIPVCLCITYI